MAASITKKLSVCFSLPCQARLLCVIEHISTATTSSKTGHIATYISTSKKQVHVGLPHHHACTQVPCHRDTAAAAYSSFQLAHILKHSDAESQHLCQLFYWGGTSLITPPANTTVTSGTFLWVIMPCLDYDTQDIYSCSHSQSVAWAMPHAQPWLPS